MIIRTGIDILDLRRIDEKIAKRVLSEKEKKIFEQIKNKRRRIEFLGGRFSIKESIIKAVGKFVPYEKVSVLSKSSGEPYLDEESIEFISNFFDEEIKVSLSISHEKDYLVSIVIIYTS